ncbi:hypothetical protein Ancab_040184 [Ancistrocladus abbreviatus]
MAQTRCSFFPSMPAAAILLIFLTIPLSASSSSSSSSVYILESQLSTTRKLLQAKQSCPVSFQSANYTVLTSKCKGPLYPPAACCAAFKEFACPYADDLNNPDNDCATIMFSYIELNGHYPAGLFARECKEGKEGLACPAAAPTPSTDVNRSPITCVRRHIEYHEEELLPVYLLSLGCMRQAAPLAASRVRRIYSYTRGVQGHVGSLSLSPPSML